MDVAKYFAKLPNGWTIMDEQINGLVFTLRMGQSYKYRDSLGKVHEVFFWGRKGGSIRIKIREIEDEENIGNVAGNR